MQQISLTPGITNLLLRWYAHNARDLPWRRGITPYRVWVSEIMLQQTRVETVIPYFLRFLRALPSEYELAEAEDETLYKLWEGLGYYSRARNLRAAARVVVRDHGGIFPGTYEDILTLPGIGPYTAGAVASIAFGARTPAVDGNVLRVVARLAEFPSDIGSASVKKRFSEALAIIYPPSPHDPEGGPGDFTQALMELGATVCTPGDNPKCPSCPLAGLCRAGRSGTAGHYPVKAAKPPRRVEERTVLLLWQGDAIAIRRREESGLLAGLWELPNLPAQLEERQALAAAAKWGVNPTAITGSHERKHIFTHVEWRMRCFSLDCSSRVPELTWATEAELKARYALPTAFRRCLG